MKLSLESIKNKEAWKGYHLPAYDPAEIAANTKDNPQWMHFGSGNIFRIFPGSICQYLIETGKMNTGIICCESYDDEVVTKCLRPYDNLTIGVTLNADGTMSKEVIGSLAESLTILYDYDKIEEIIKNPSLQMISFTITEKGYSLRNAKNELVPAVIADMENGPAGCRSFMAQLASMCLARKAACGKPLALVSMDNCSHNGEKLQSAILEIAKAWLDGGRITEEEYTYLAEEVQYPWSMIDKITPRPHPMVEEMLKKDGLEEISPFVTTKNTFTAPFVNAEGPQYLVIEDKFPNGRPELEAGRGVILTTREKVNAVETMKVTTCLNPLHTALAVYGCLLGHTLISEEMSDAELKTLVTRMAYEEGMPVVVNPGILDPKAFVNEVLTVRFPNPFMPDAPQRIATDTSQKLAIRYGETIKSYERAEDKEPADLKLIPLVQAGWLRYLLAVDDEGNAMDCSADPLLASSQEKLAGIRLGDTVDAERLRPILSETRIWGVDLFACGLADKIVSYFNELIAGPGAVRATLKRHVL